MSTMQEALQSACASVFPGACFPNVYTGTLLEYVVWNYDEIPAVYAERAPQASRYLCQVHLYYPHKKNPLTAIQALRWALWEAQFTWPSLTDASDGDGQHYVLECQFADGGGFWNGVNTSSAAAAPSPQGEGSGAGASGNTSSAADATPSPQGEG